MRLDDCALMHGYYIRLCPNSRESEDALAAAKPDDEDNILSAASISAVPGRGRAERTADAKDRA
jgi:hypothetical protein